MEDPEAMLKEIKQSLIPERIQATPDFSAFRQRIDSLKKLDPNLFTLFRMADEILGYIDQHQRDQELVEKASQNLVKLNVQVDSNLKRLDGVQERLAERIRRFDLLEAKYINMIAHVNSSLDELNRVLRQM